MKTLAEKRGCMNLIECYLKILTFEKESTSNARYIQAIAIYEEFIELPKLKMNNSNDKRLVPLTMEMRNELMRKISLYKSNKHNNEIGEDIPSNLFYKVKKEVIEEIQKQIYDDYLQKYATHSSQLTKLSTNQLITLPTPQKVFPQRRSLSYNNDPSWSQVSFLRAKKLHNILEDTTCNNNVMTIAQNLNLIHDLHFYYRIKQFKAMVELERLADSILMAKEIYNEFLDEYAPQRVTCCKKILSEQIERSLETICVTLYQLSISIVPVFNSIVTALQSSMEESYGANQRPYSDSFVSNSHSQSVNSVYTLNSSSFSNHTVDPIPVNNSTNSFNTNTSKYFSSSSTLLDNKDNARFLSTISNLSKESSSTSFPSRKYKQRKLSKIDESMEKQNGSKKNSIINLSGKKTSSDNNLIVNNTNKKLSSDLEAILNSPNLFDSDNVLSDNIITQYNHFLSSNTGDTFRSETPGIEGDRESVELSWTDDNSDEENPKKNLKKNLKNNERNERNESNEGENVDSDNFKIVEKSPPVDSKGGLVVERNSSEEIDWSDDNEPPHKEKTLQNLHQFTNKTSNQNENKIVNNKNKNDRKEEKEDSISFSDESDSDSENKNNKKHISNKKNESKNVKNNDDKNNNDNNTPKNKDVSPHVNDKGGLVVERNSS
eukprot:TRINITY_DN1385_c0_g1_i14.p1 TRINITY_DN1385_c0_g1~~TRINITY_DN1385_c0_g1_i14.p1  ORF type:complete len:684 (+),score=198.46 TRINITY_DN1385_c0_g1_i14:74-2053(+)